MRIGELARRSGVSARLLRYYEEQGLLRPQRSPSGYREYGPGDVETVHRIRALLTAGLSTSLIARVLPCVQDGGERLVPNCPYLISELHSERARLSEAIETLRRTRGLLDDVIAAAPANVAELAASQSLRGERLLERHETALDLGDPPGGMPQVEPLVVVGHERAIEDGQGQ